MDLWDEETSREVRAAAEEASREAKRMLAQATPAPEASYDERGMRQEAALEGTAPGGEVRCYEASSVLAAQVWIDVKTAPALSAAVTAGEGIIQLTVAEAVALAKQLLALAAHHYQLQDEEE